MNRARPDTWIDGYRDRRPEIAAEINERDDIRPLTYPCWEVHDAGAGVTLLKVWRYYADDAEASSIELPTDVAGGETYDTAEAAAQVARLYAGASVGRTVHRQLPGFLSRPGYGHACSECGEPHLGSAFEIDDDGQPRCPDRTDARLTDF